MDRCFEKNIFQKYPKIRVGVLKNVSLKNAQMKNSKKGVNRNLL